MIKAILLDMDDTLIFNQTLYEYAHAMLFGYMGHFSVSVEEASRVFEEIDKEMFKTYGYSRRRYPASFEALLRHFVPEADETMARTVRGYAETVFTTIAKVKPGVEEAIEIMARHYPVYIVTAGDRDVQETRISHLPFKDKFTGVFIVDRKTPELFVAIARKLGVAPGDLVMAGDSLKSDVVPAVAAGLQAVWIEAHNSPLHESGHSLPERGAYKFHSLHELARQVAQHKVLAPPQPARKRRSGPRLG